jgi:hypothetical protein
MNKSEENTKEFADLISKLPEKELEKMLAFTRLLHRKHKENWSNNDIRRIKSCREYKALKGLHTNEEMKEVNAILFKTA